MSFGEKIRVARECRKINLRYMSRITGLPQDRISDLESEVGEAASKTEVVLIGDALGEDVAALYALSCGAHAVEEGD